jgi:23S rRNA pseudouridine1911/1915/1917 synthase
MRHPAAEDIDEIDSLDPLRLSFSIDERRAGERLDKALASLMPEISRSRLQQWVVAGAVRVNGAAVRPRHELAFGDLIELEPQPAPDAAAFRPEPIPLDIVHEDDAILVLNKPAGIVVHPAAGHWSGTLLNGLLAHAPQLAGVPRAGIVHRLDAGTSGLMVVAKSLAAQTELVRQLQDRAVTREYWAIVLGAPAARGIIDAPIGRDPRNPLRFRVSHHAGSKPARTQYARLQTARIDDAELSWIACRLETGRTHQIRVHMEHLGHPLIGDPIYRRRLPARAAAGWRNFGRQALHACRLAFQHPLTRERVGWFSAPPPDLARLMTELGFGPIDAPSAAFECQL